MRWVWPLRPELSGRDQSARGYSGSATRGAKSMKPAIHPYDVTQETDMMAPLDFNRRSRLKHVDKIFKAEITNVIHLTEMEKLFHVINVSRPESHDCEPKA